MPAPLAPLVLRFGDLVIDLEHYRVLLDDRPLVLSYRDYALLVYLASRPGQVVHKRRLLEEGLGRHDPGGLRTVEERIRHLKRTLERQGRVFIEEAGEAGYRFRPFDSAVGFAEGRGERVKRVEPRPAGSPPAM